MSFNDLRQDPEGRTVWFPRGPGKQGYIVPNLEEVDRLRRLYRLQLYGGLLFLSLGYLLATRLFDNMQGDGSRPFTVFMGAIMGSLMSVFFKLAFSRLMRPNTDKWKVCNLNLSWIERERDVIRQMPGWFQVGCLIPCLGFAAVGVFMFVKGPGGDRVWGVSMILLFGTVAGVLITGLIFKWREAGGMK